MNIPISRPLRVFLCYSSDDKPTVRDIYDRLDSEGWIDAWLDEKKLLPGQDWNYEIEQAVEEADVILVCLTKKSVTKEGYVQRELSTILDFANYKPEGTLYIIPVRLEECEPPKRIRRWQYADYFPKSQQDIGYQRLLESLKFRATRLGISTIYLAQGEIGREVEEGLDEARSVTTKPELLQKQEYRSHTSVPPRSESILGARTSATPSAFDAKLTVLQGVGSSKAALLAKLGLYTLGDMLYYYPSRYDDYSQSKPIRDLFYGDQISLIGTIQSVITQPSQGRNASFIDVTINDGSGVLNLLFFDEPELTTHFRVNDAILVSGNIDQSPGRLIMKNPNWEYVGSVNLHTNKVVPIYSLTRGITQKWLRNLMRNMVEYWTPAVVDALPKSILLAVHLMSLDEALLQIHFPHSLEKLQEARERLAFDEIFYLQLILLRQKRSWESVDAKRFNTIDMRLLEKACNEARKLFDNDPELSQPEHTLLADALKRFWAEAQ